MNLELTQNSLYVHVILYSGKVPFTFYAIVSVALAWLEMLFLLFKLTLPYILPFLTIEIGSCSYLFVVVLLSNIFYVLNSSLAAYDSCFVTTAF